MTATATATDGKSQKALKDRRQQELEQIRSRAGGVLKPEDVVAFARNPKTALHSWFTWDDSAAAAEYRLWQARQVIRVCVRVVEGDKEPPVRTYVSLYEDRGQDGYRLLTDVLSDEEMCETLLEQALAEFKAWEAKYRQLKKLAPIFAAGQKVVLKYQRGGGAGNGHHRKAADKA